MHNQSGKGDSLGYRQSCQFFCSVPCRTTRRVPLHCNFGYSFCILVNSNLKLGSTEMPGEGTNDLITVRIGMAAKPGGGDYGRLSVMIQYHCRVEPLFRIGPGAFSPAPKVESAFVRLTPWLEPPVHVKDTACLSTLVRQAFSQRRKTLRNSLKGLLTEQAIKNTGTDPSARPETITLEQYAELANTYFEMDHQS